MPEEDSSGTDLEKLLDSSDDYTLNVHNYQAIQNALDKDDILPVAVIEKLLAVSIRDLKDDLKNSVNILNIIFTVLKKIKTQQSSLIPDLVPSAIAVMNILKTTALFNKVEALKTLCFEIIMSYPDETLISLVVNHNTEIMEIFNLYSHQRIPQDIRILPVAFLIKLLKILPREKKAVFVKDGMNVWFSKIIPIVNFNFATVAKGVEALELITEDLVHLDYADNSHWRVVLQNIYTPQKYPNLMKSLLEDGNDSWHRLWIVFIKLLKNQITKTTNTVGSPINSMLPVVELAFKMDVANRCRAFTCWNVLIDNFSTETNEVYINKRIKLLIIPLMSNNAKVEETALAKLKTWWHLINRFYHRLDKFSDTVLMPFLHFCFGKPITSDKPVMIPGTLTHETKYQCVQAFINIIGHVNCEGCVPMPKLKGKLLTTKLLVGHWRDWIYALNSAIKICTESDEFSEEQINCLWKSFIITIGELPENNIRRDLFNEALALLDKFAGGCSDKVAILILNVLIKVLFDKNEKIQPLLKSKDEQNAPIHKIIAIIFKLPLSNLENRCLVIQNLRLISTLLFKEGLKYSSTTIECVLEYMPQNGYLLWIAFADTISELLYALCPQMLYKMILWPLNNINAFANENILTTAWINMYNSVFSKIHLTTINEDIIKLFKNSSNNLSSNNFILEAAITMLDKKVSEDHCSDLINETVFLKDILSKVDNIQDITSVFSLLSEVLVKVLNKQSDNITFLTIENTVSIIGIILNLCQQIPDDTSLEVDIVNKLEVIFKALEAKFKLEIFTKLKFNLLDQLKSCASYLKRHKFLKGCLLNIYVNETKENIEDSVKGLIVAFDEASNLSTTKEESKDLSSRQINFSTPSSKPGPKRFKKKETNIVNTVTENGEEYAVIKSNWKFNPRKLTDNQKEKLQRKREDIPALYQDLSQSQDEFKLNTWKTDSQDTTTTSKSTSEQGHEDVSTILKNIPQVDFASKILQNIKPSEKLPNDQNSTNKEKPNINKEENKSDIKLQVTVKDPKSPKLALKDRVFRNVRNLIEKSNLNEGLDLNSTIAENVIKTPTSKLNVSINVTNSAPSLISADRPSRLKRKPKKFDDLQLFGLKRRRNSGNRSDSPTDTEKIESNNPENDVDESFNQSSYDEIAKVEKDAKIRDSAEDNIPKQTRTELFEIEACSQEHNKEIITEDTINQQKKSTLTNINDSQIEVDTKEPEEKPAPIKETDLELANIDHLNSSIKKNVKNKILEGQKSASKKSGSKRSRIEKELAIDMVEGHPFLQSHLEPTKTPTRLTRKAILNSPCTRKKSSETPNKSKIETKSTPKSEKKTKDKDKSISIKETQNTEDMLGSQDIIESSQESTLTTISVKSSKSIAKKVPIITLVDNEKDNQVETQKMLDDIPNDIECTNMEVTDDTLFPRNKTVDDKVLIDLTENMDTEVINEDDVIVINDDDDLCVAVEKNVSENTDNTVVIENKTAYTENKQIDTQNTAEADTQSLDPALFITDLEKDTPKEAQINITLETNPLIENNGDNNVDNDVDNDVTNASFVGTPIDATKTMSESALEVADENLNSPFKDEEQRKKDFLNNTLEISPIKILSPVKENKSPSPETSSDYVVIKLSSPVQSNGEPLEKVESPEIFTADKLSPDKRDQSPPREEVSVTNTSPSSSLSLKKNRPQVRIGGRAAQMLGLCVPNRLQTIMTSDKLSESDDSKKNPSLNTSARRNLRILYNTPTAETPENPEEQETQGESFLKLKRSLPTTDSSPSGPILKRKLADITDETTASPANKRKRVSFHDPPVSTTICVKKYIEPCGLRSPQNSLNKRQERQLRSQLAIKSPKRLDNVFKLDSVLTKTVESFSNIDTPNTNEDSELSSLDQTPIVQVVKTSDLNDRDPICPELIDCKDPIANIASELSSPSMKELLIKEFDGKIDTIGGLAQMTELEINRLSLKAPKIEVVKKVLSEYLKTVADISPLEEAVSESMPKSICTSVEVQTNTVTSSDMVMQTNELDLSTNSTQTDLTTAHCSVQTDESGSKTTGDIVTSCLTEKIDFVEQLCEKMDANSKKTIVNSVSFNTLTDILINKLTTSNSDYILNRVIEERSKLDNKNIENNDARLSIIQDYLCERIDSKNLVLFCSELLKRVYDKP